MKVLKRCIVVISLLSMILITGCKSEVKEVENIEPNDNDIVILFTDDMHCGIDENIGLKGLMKYYNDIKNEGAYTALVDAGDFSHGDTIAVISKGETLYRMMKDLDYDFIVPSNHEFDYGVPHFLDMSKYLEGKIYAVNFYDAINKKDIFLPYKIMTFGNKKVAFIGSITPKCVALTSPLYFKNKEGKTTYSFYQENDEKKLIKKIQEAIKNSKKEGADYVVLVGYPGIYEGTDEITTNILKKVKGIDCIIDANSPKPINTFYVDGEGRKVPVAKADEKLSSFGKILISKDGSISISMIDRVDGEDEDTKMFIDMIKMQSENSLQEILYNDNKIHFAIIDPKTNKRMVRQQNTNLANFAADAYRYIGKTDISIVNGGALRDEIQVGDVTYNDLLKVFPFSNLISTAEIKGQDILDALELGARFYPAENGCLFHPSGMTYTIDSTIPSSVVVDEEGGFLSVDGEYRVKDVMIGDKPLDVEKTYTITDIDYHLKRLGDGCTMMKNAKIINESFILDFDMLVRYFDDADMSRYENIYGEERIKFIR